MAKIYGDKDYLYLPYRLALLAELAGFDVCCTSTYRVVGLMRNMGGVNMDIFWANAEYELRINDGSCRNFYGKECYAPMYQEITDWLRANHHIRIQDAADFLDTDATVMVLKFRRKDDNSYCEHKFAGASFYEVLDEAIEKAFSIITNPVK